MSTVYFRKQRLSTNDPATAGDLPQEVLRKTFVYLLPGEADLLAPRMACRAWKPVADGLIYARQKFNDDKRIARVACGFHLHSLVFGPDCISINRLELKMKDIERGNILTLVRLVASSLSSLCLDFQEDNEDDKSCLPLSVCYATLDAFFLRCHQVRSLKLKNYDLGTDTSFISSSIKSGLSRLTNFTLNRCGGDIPMFIREIPIPLLRSIRIWSDASTARDYDIVDAIADNYRTIVNFDLVCCYISSDNLIKIAQCCPRVERIALCTPKNITRSDIELLASLPLLRHLDFLADKVSSESITSLALMKNIKHLGVWWNDAFADLLSSIGPNLVSLEIWDATDVALMAVYAHCPNLLYLQIVGDEISEGSRDVLGSVNIGMKKRLKKLTCFKVGSYGDELDRVRLGTDWPGYKIDQEDL
jgi:hypothetical protein